MALITLIYYGKELSYLDKVDFNIKLTDLQQLFLFNANMQI